MARPGKVYLVGAGPGAPDLITVKGLECLRGADVIVYDRLVDRRLLDETRRDAELLYVGKSSNRHTFKQGEINRLLVDKAIEGKVVVRLKGGDPFVFGRGGEEIEELASEEIAFEVVPGVTAAAAVPAYAGIPVTHRKMASSFAVVTGHKTPGKEKSSINWNGLATGVDTLVFLMGVTNLGHIVKQLLRHGRPAETPVAVIRDGTLPKQRTVVSTLGDIVVKAEEARIEPPSVIVVGEVVRLRENLQWFESRPLLGKRILVTRTRQQASILSKTLEENGAEAIELPVIRIEPLSDNNTLDRAIDELPDYDWVIFTSANAVDVFLQRFPDRDEVARKLQGLKIGAIGPATADALNRYDLRADHVPQRYVAESILDEIGETEMWDKRVLLPRAERARPELVHGLEHLGARVDEVILYRTVPANKVNGRTVRMLKEGTIDVITFTSSSTVRNLVRLLGDDWRSINRAMVACIGPITAATAVDLGVKVGVVAEEHTIPGLVRAIVHVCERTEVRE